MESVSVKADLSIGTVRTRGGTVSEQTTKYYSVHVKVNTTRVTEGDQFNAAAPSTFGDHVFCVLFNTEKKPVTCYRFALSYSLPAMTFPHYPSRQWMSMSDEVGILQHKFTELLPKVQY